ncbi:Hly-III related protein [Kipferlia bialata]|uniref:Hly-III related protein n=1 Tax=Kipferlia bialata TaxID=797122 RepID=A0A9K3D667_9EUKA|nr:Hly-III related protein [Kipferlia bialata]|eukprot:g10648.t1
MLPSMETRFCLYLASSLYHGVPGRHTGAKKAFRVLDHAVIYILIAGTYTPVLLGTLPNPWSLSLSLSLSLYTLNPRWILLSVMWVIGIAGVLMKVIGDVGAYPRLSTGLYLFMGWVGVLAGKPLLAVLPTRGLVFLVAGGLFYSLGCIFFMTDHVVKYGHFIWHLFVMSLSLSLSL